jgi:hypothetical protein
MLYGNRYSLVGIVTKLRAGRLRNVASILGRVKGHLPKAFRPDLEPSQPFLPAMLGPGIKLPVCETDRSPPSSAGVKNK